jgi:hypothetical protein
MGVRNITIKIENICRNILVVLLVISFTIQIIKAPHRMKKYNITNLITASNDKFETI